VTLNQMTYNNSKGAFERWMG